MSLSTPQRAVLLTLDALDALEALNGRETPDLRWPARVVLVAAQDRGHPGAASITPRTIASLARRCLVFVTDEPHTGREPTLELTEAGRARLRAGLTTTEGPTT